MTYDPNPLNGLLDRFFVQDSDGIAFSVPGLLTRLPVTEEEYYAARARLKIYSGVARVFSFALSGVALVWMYWRVSQGALLSLTLMTGLGAAFVPALLAHVVANEIVLAPFRRRVMALDRQNRGAT